MCECYGLALPDIDWKAAAGPPLLGTATLLKFEDLRVHLIGLVFFLTCDFFHKPVVLNTCLNSSCSYYL